MAALWKIMRPRWWLLRRQFQRGGRGGALLTVGLGLAVLAGGAWAFRGLVRFLAGPAGTGGLVAVVPGALAMLLFFVLIQLADIMHQFYLAPDIVYLQAAPVTPGALYAARLLASTQVVVLPAAGSLLVLVALGAAQAAPWVYYPLAALLAGAAAGLATAAGVVLVMLVAGVLPPQRLRRWLPVGFAGAALGSLLLQQVVLNQLARWDPLMRLLAAALLAPGRLAAIVLVVSAAALLLAAAGWLLFNTVYPRTVNELTIVAPSAPRVRRAAPPGLVPRLAAALAGPFPAAQRLILTKEWLTLLRDPQRLTNLVMVPLVMAVLLFPILAGRDAAAGLRLLVFWMLLAYAALFGLNASQAAALPAFLLEGRRLLLLRQTPLSMRQLLWAKFWAACLPTVLVWWVVLLVCSLVMRLPAWQAAALLLAAAAGLTGLCAIMVPIGALGADYAVTEARPKVSGAATALSWLGLLLGAVWQGAMLALALYLILLLGRATELAAVTRAALSVLPAGRLLADPGLWLPGLALAAGAGVGLITARLWRAAQRRLETWEPAQA